MRSSSAARYVFISKQSSLISMASTSGAGPSRVPTTTLKAKASIADRPLSGIFGLHKPSGPLSMTLLEDLKELLAHSKLFRNADGSVPSTSGGKGWRGGKAGKKGGKQKKGGPAPPKIGQGGTLDPLADGVLVIGIGSGTKELQRFLDCTKEYRATGLLGTATTSYDSQDPILLRAPYAHVSASAIESILPRFRGPQQQLPPLYSAIRIDGKRLFEYAREGLELPRPIPARSVEVKRLELVSWHEGGEHAWVEPDRECGEEEKSLVGRVRSLAGLDPEPVKPVEEAAAAAEAGAEGSVAATDAATAPISEAPAASSTSTDAVAEGASSSAPPPAFTIDMTVTSGTYVRSIVHDIGAALGSAAHVVRLTRVRQGEFSIGELGPEARAADAPAEGTEGAEKGTAEVALPGNCIEWSVFEKALKAQEKGELEKDQDGLAEWERILLTR